jgi:hypothetical protein
VNDINQGNQGDRVAELLGGALQGRGADCLSHAALDRLALGEATASESSAASAHVASCARCTAACQRLAQDRASFLATANVNALAADALARAGSRATAPAGWRRLLPVFGVVAVAGVALLVAGPKQPVQDQGDAPAATGYARKGGNFGLSVYVLHREAGGPADATGQLHTGEPLHPGDRIRLQLTSQEAGYALVLGVDAAAKVSVYHPQASAAQPIAATSSGAGELLPQAIELDDTLGPETLVALRCKQPLPVSAAVAAARALGTAGGKAQLGLPCTEIRYVIEKVAP